MTMRELRADMQFIANRIAANGDHFTLAEVKQIINEHGWDGADYSVRTKGITNPKIIRIIIFESTDLRIGPVHPVVERPEVIYHDQ